VALVAWARDRVPTQASCWATSNAIRTRWCTTPPATAFVERAINEIIVKRMNKQQQMRWNRATLQSFFDVRTAVLNDTLEAAFRHRFQGFRPANDDPGCQQPDYHSPTILNALARQLRRGKPARSIQTHGLGVRPAAWSNTFLAYRHGISYAHQWQRSSAAPPSQERSELFG